MNANGNSSNVNAVKKIEMTDAQLLEFAREHNIDVKEAKSLLANLNWRAEYRASYNRRPEVKAKRALRNARAYALRQSLKEVAKELQSDSDDQS